MGIHDWGTLELRCTYCQAAQDVALVSLYKSWKTAIGKDVGGDEISGRFTATVKCFCGSKTKYDSPIFNFIFDIIFRELFEDESIN